MKSRCLFPLLLLLSCSGTQHLSAQPAPKQDVSRLAKDDPPGPVKPFLVSIEGNEKADVGDLVVLNAVADGATNFSWTLTNSDKRFIVSDGGKTLTFASGKAGVYVFYLAASNATDLGVAKFAVTLGTPEPEPPGPGPGPDPKPPGPVTPTKLFVVIVEETADAVANRGVMLSDATLSARMKERGHKFRVVDKDVVDSKGNPPADVKPLLDRAKGKAYPQVYLVDEGGKIRFEGDLPKTPAELVAALQKCGG